MFRISIGRIFIVLGFSAVIGLSLGLLCTDLHSGDFRQFCVGAFPHFGIHLGRRPLAFEYDPRKIETTEPPGKITPHGMRG